jgi:hypothetical protein
MRRTCFYSLWRERIFLRVVRIFFIFGSIEERVCYFEDFWVGVEVYARL